MSFIIIKNGKIVSGQLNQQQSDWEQSNPSNVSFIKNKPSIPSLISDLNNDVGFITISDIPLFNPSNYDLNEFNNNGLDPFARISDISAGNTNLSYEASPTQGTVVSDTGNDAIIPLTDNTNAGLFSPEEKSKLSSISNGAEVNVNADWNATSGDAQILNKPDLSQFETSSQLNDRDVNNRNRANHTGVQPSSTISDFNLAVSSNLDVATNTLARHTHPNKPLLDTYTQTDVNLGDAVLKKHTHANFAALDAVSGINTGDETTSTIQTKRPLKTVASQSLEGVGNISLSRSDVNLGNVDNTSDLNKPISTATQTALDNKITQNAWVDISLTSTITGFSSFTTRQIQYLIDGNQCTLACNLIGASNSGLLEFNLPFNIGSRSLVSISARVQNSGLVQNTAGFVLISANSNLVQVFLNANQASFGTSNTKAAQFTVTFNL